MAVRTSGALPLPNFTPKQRTHIQSHLPPFTAYLEQYNPTVLNYHKGTSEWMSQRSKEIISNELFAVGELNGRDPAKVELEIRLFFRNWKNNTYKKSLRASAVTTSSSPSPPISSPPPSAPIARALKDALRGYVIISSDLSTRDLYLKERPDDVRQAEEEVRAQMAVGTPACVVSQKAMKLAWDRADREHWEKRKRELELDVTGNQAVWPKYLREAIQENLDRGVVGSALVGVMYAMRTESEGLQHGILYAGYDAVNQEEIRHMPSPHTEILHQWVAHADIHLPHVGKPSIYQFDRDERGFPKLPVLDLDEVSLKQIGDLLTLYLGMVWDHGYPPENSMPGIPWSEVAQDPASHYDVKAFTFGCLIGSPKPCKLIDAPGLYDALFEYQKAGTPFRFVKKAEYLSCARAAAQRLVDETEKGDEADQQGPSGGPGSETSKGSDVRPPMHASAAAAVSALEIQVKEANGSPGGSDILVSPPASPKPILPATPSPQRVPPPTPKLGKMAKKPTSKKRKTMAVVTNTEQAYLGSPQRPSKRARKQAGFGIQLVAGGQRSPRGRKPAWEYRSAGGENQVPVVRSPLH